MDEIDCLKALLDHIHASRVKKLASGGNAESGGFNPENDFNNGDPASGVLDAVTFGMWDKVAGAAPQDQFQATAPSIQQYGYGDNANQSLGQANAANAGQAALAGQLQNQANGIGPSLAQMQLQKATQANIQNASGQAASARGMSPAMAQRLAMQNAAAANQGAAGQSAMTRLMEQRQAQEQLGNVLSQQRAAANQMYGTNVQGMTGYNNALTQGQLGAQEINAKTAAANTAGQRGLLGGILGGLGAGGQSGGFADGGIVRSLRLIDVPDRSVRMDEGGRVDAAHRKSVLDGYLRHVAPVGLDEGGDPVDASDLVNSHATPAVSDIQDDPFSGRSLIAGQPVSTSHTSALAPLSEIADSGLSDSSPSVYQSPGASRVQAVMDKAGNAPTPTSKSSNWWLPMLIKFIMGGAMAGANKKVVTPRAYDAGGDVVTGLGDVMKLDQSSQQDDGTQSPMQKTMSTLGPIVSLISLLDNGGPVPGKARFPGVDDKRNDTVPAILSPTETVLPQTVTHSDDPPIAAAGFVGALNAGMDPKAAKQVAMKADRGNLGSILARLGALENKSKR